MASEGSGWFADWGGWSGIADNLMPDNIWDKVTPDNLGYLAGNGGTLHDYDKNWDGSDRAVGSTVGAGAGTMSGSQMDEKAKLVRKGRNTLRDLDGAYDYKFNPPLHPAIRNSGKGQNLPDFELRSDEEGGLTSVEAGLYRRSIEGTDGTKIEGDLDTFFPVADGRDAKIFRLGQILCENGAPVTTAYNENSDDLVRYGFRFLYNPPSITFNSGINYTINTSSLMDGGNARFLTTGGMGTIGLELFLNRIPDVTADPAAWGEESDRKIDAETREALRTQGTMLDLDYLFRVSNGVFEIDDSYPIDKTTQQAKKKQGKNKKGDTKTEVTLGVPTTKRTGDIGMILPTPSWLTIGPSMRYYGWIAAVTVQHIMFSRSMVPMLTKVNITFQRMFAGTQEQIDAINASAAGAGAAKGDVFEETGTGKDCGARTAAQSPASDGSDIAVPGAGASMEKNGAYIWRRLVAAGYSEEQAAGVLGNLEQESGFSPTADQYGRGLSDGNGYGIAQWTFTARQGPLRKYAQQHGGSYKDLDMQVGFMLKEMADGVNGYNDKKFRKIKDVVDACIYFHDGYEGSADSADFVRNGRGKMAQKWYRKFKGLTSSGGSSRSLPVVRRPLPVGDSTGTKNGYTSPNYVGVMKNYRFTDQEKAIDNNTNGGIAAHMNTIIGLRTLHTQFPKVKEAGTWRKDDPYPDHPSGLAIDVMVYDNKSLGDAVNKFFNNTYKDELNVKYTLWQTTDHYDHVHVAFYPSKEEGKPSGKYASKASDWPVKVPRGDLDLTGMSGGSDASVRDQCKGGDTGGGSGVAGGNWTAPLRVMDNGAGYSWGEYPHNGHPHGGEDYSASTGTPAYAMTDAKCTFIGSPGLVVFQTDLTGGKFNFGYMHMSKIGVKVGDTVKSGEKIGETGETGAEGAPHLHFETYWGNTTSNGQTPSSGSRLSDRAVDPNEVMRALGIKVANDNTEGGLGGASYNPKPDYSASHLADLKNKLSGGTVITTSRKKKGYRPGTHDGSFSTSQDRRLVAAASTERPRVITEASTWFPWATKTPRFDNPLMAKNTETRKAIWHVVPAATIAEAEVVLDEDGAFRRPHLFVDLKQGVVVQRYPVDQAARMYPPAGGSLDPAGSDKAGTLNVQIAVCAMSGSEADAAIRADLDKGENSIMRALTQWLELWGVPRAYNDMDHLYPDDIDRPALSAFYQDGHISGAWIPGELSEPVSISNWVFLSESEAVDPAPDEVEMDVSALKDVGADRGVLYSTDGNNLYVANIYDYVGDGPAEMQRGREYLYASVDYRLWAAQRGSQTSRNPRSPVQAIEHIVSYLEFHDAVVNWEGRGADAMARAYGLLSARLQDIPNDVVGPPMSSTRMFRWILRDFPDFAVPAASPRSFGNAVPIGALLFWDETVGNGYGAVGIAAGYRNGILQQFTVAEPGAVVQSVTATIPALLANGKANPAYAKAQRAGIDVLENLNTHTVVLRDVPPMGCLGWSAPIFSGPGTTVGFKLWEV